MKNTLYITASCLSALLTLAPLSTLADDAKSSPSAAPLPAAGSAAGSAASSATSSPEAILQQLLAGNQRFVANALTHTNQTASRRDEVAKGQHPVAMVLTCSDSRVPPEVVFDQGLGDLFVIRNAGNILDDHGLGSMEYAVEHLHVTLLVVLGHEKCGAVSAAAAGGEVPGHIRSIVEAIEPAVETAKTQSGDLVDNAVRANVTRVVGQLKHIGPILSEAISAGKLKVVGARYDLDSGRVEILP